MAIVYAANANSLAEVGDITGAGRAAASARTYTRLAMLPHAIIIVAALVIWLVVALNSP